MISPQQSGQPSWQIGAPEEFSSSLHLSKSQPDPLRSEGIGRERKEQGPNGVAMDYRTVLIQRTVRSGQSIRYPGNVVIMGDVNPGAEIIAGGNIIVMGNLRGMAHAGASGNQNSVVAAFRLQPTQLRIADHITRAPDGESVKPDQPEIARIQNGVVVIERYQPNSLRFPAF
ncbi:MAG: septum site-determining protein MinC [Bacillota bacterium]